MLVSAFGLHRAGNPPESYEDAHAFSDVDGRFAITDGATESVYAERWARQLVDAFVREPFATGPVDLGRWLAPLQRAWYAAIEWSALPWNVLEKAERGAFAALLTLSLRPDGSWTAVAVGDACVCLVRDGKVDAFPIQRSVDFSDRPLLVPSNPAGNDGLPDAVTSIDGVVRPGDHLYLMTDALAQWFLAGHERGARPWEFLDDASTPAAFERLVGELRASHELRNDDVTLIRIEVDAGDVSS